MYGELQAKCDIGMERMPSIPEQLKHRKADLEKQLADLNKLIESFEENPSLAETLTLLRRVI